MKVKDKEIDVYVSLDKQMLVRTKVEFDASSTETL